MVTSTREYTVSCCSFSQCPICEGEGAMEVEVQLRIEYDPPDGPDAMPQATDWEFQFLPSTLTQAQVEELSNKINGELDDIGQAHVEDYFEEAFDRRYR